MRAVTVRVAPLPRAQFQASTGQGLIRRYGKGPVPLRQPDVRSVRTPEVNEIILAVTVKVSTLPGAQSSWKRHQASRNRIGDTVSRRPEMWLAPPAGVR